MNNIRNVLLAPLLVILAVIAIVFTGEVQAQTKSQSNWVSIGTVGNSSTGARGTAYFDANVTRLKPGFVRVNKYTEFDAGYHVQLIEFDCVDQSYRLLINKFEVKPGHLRWNLEEYSTDHRFYFSADSSSQLVFNNVCKKVK